ncbi:PH domain-containing protein [Pinibacter aurantiacus]|uniref:PH domain-containing protein n=1 Tax=Pinibacter aurantiacus TaxID=2851599 RepID=A0A9E2S7R2_9BACT|nr:PH domain-containing protein [Pinibacter aurantiacus]MBV4356452.1 PH domain-containing protein [Pinibacter aurantiacus]
MINFKNFLNEEQDPKAVEKISERLNSMLMTGEDVQYIAVQKKPAINLTPDCLVLTNKRIIVFRPKNLGLAMDLEDYIWRDVLSCHLKENIWGSEFTIQTIDGAVNKIDFLPKAQARKLYTMAQEQEEIQKEVRRQRDLEEKRASAGRLVVSGPTAQSQTNAESQKQQDDPVAVLQKLKTLLDNKLISQEEYDAKKAEVLSRM